MGCFGEIFEDCILYVYEDVLINYENSEWAKYFSEILPISTEISASGISIQGVEYSDLFVGSSLQLTAVVEPPDATVQEVVWQSSDENVAVVSETGLLTALNEGTVVIRVCLATDSSINASCELNVVREDTEVNEISAMLQAFTMFTHSGSQATYHS